MLAGMTNRAYLNWRRYWDEEPWGPWRDNMHMAVLAREVRRPQLKPGAANKHEDFMLRRPVARRKEKAASLLGFLRTVGKPNVKLRKRKARRK